MSFSTTYQFNFPIRDNNVLLIIAFLIAVLSHMEINVIGRLYVVEIFFLFAAVFFIPIKGRELLKRRPWSILVLLVIWLFSQVLSDIILDTNFNDYSRGWAKIFFLGINFIILYLFLRTEKRILFFMLGLSVAAIIESTNFMKVPTMWKFGGGVGVAIFSMTCIALYYRENKNINLFYIVNTLVLFIFSIVSIMFNARSLAALFFLASFYVFLSSKSRICKKTIFSKKSIIKVLFILFFAIFMIWGLLIFYGHGAKENWFGSAVKEKYEMQKIDGYGAWGIVLGGRSELLVSLKAISDSPVIGHGSWAKDAKYVLMREQLLEEMSISDKRDSLLESNLIPSHSHVFGAWVEAGFIGGFFWIIIFSMILNNLVKLSSVRHYMNPLITVVFIMSFWDILFSPFGAHRRISWALTFVLLIYTSTIVKNANISKFKFRDFI